MQFFTPLYKILRWSEKYLKTDMVYLVKGGFWLSMTNIISSALVFVMAIIYANQVSAHVYGTYKFLLSTLGILSITTLTGMGPILAQAVSRGKEGSFFEVLRTKITWGILGAIAALCASFYYYTNGNVELSIAFLLAAFFVPFMDSFNLYQEYLQGKKLFKESSIFATFTQLCATSLMIVTVFFSNHIYAIFLAYMISWTTLRFYFLFKTIKKYPPNNAIDSSTIPYGKHSSFIDVIATLIGSLDQILIFHYLGAVDLALYSFAIAPVTQLVSVFRNIPTLAMPKLAARAVPEINVMLRKRVLLFVILAMGIIAAYIVAAPYIYSILFPQYIDSVWLSRIFALTMLFTIPQTILGPAISAKVMMIPKKLLYIWNLPGLISTIFIFTFITKMGVVSVVFGRLLLVLISIVISCSLWLYIVRKDRKENVHTPLSIPNTN